MVFLVSDIERARKYGERLGFFFTEHSSMGLVFNVYANMPFYKVFC